MKNIFYLSSFSPIGGTETFIYYLCKKYRDWDITVYYSVGDPDQLARLRKVARVRRYMGEHIVCDKAFFNYNAEIIDNVEAKEYIGIIHYDPLAVNFSPHVYPQITRYIAVSENSAKHFTERTGIPCEVCYNPLPLEKPRKMLKLISATRLTREKGKERMKTLADTLTEHNVPFEWVVYTNDARKIDNPNVFYRPVSLDLTDQIASADYLVQLSDCEGYCFAVAEALTLGTPVIVTPCPVFEEIGVVDGENAIVLPFGMEYIPCDRIQKGLKKFKYTPKKDRWEEILLPGERDPEKPVLVCRVIQKYYDVQFAVTMNKGEVFSVDKERAEYLASLGLVEIQ